MLIANPIYDVVFKYLMEDKEIAKGLISSIIGEEIIELTLRPQESSTRSEQFDIIIFRLDFHAVIKTKVGKHKKILIELQKSKNLADIMRFRRYLGESYQRADEIGTGENKEKIPLPIIPIYFLGFKLRNVPTAVLRVNRQYVDLLHNRTLNAEEAFIEKLSHDSFVIQIPRLTRGVQTALEWVLTIFNQSYVTQDSKMLEVSSKEIGKNELLSKMVARLRMAVSEPEILKGILLEEEVESIIKKHIREKQELAETNKEQEDIIKEKDHTIKEQDKALKEKDDALKERDDALKEKDRLIEELMKKLADKDE